MVVCVPEQNQVNGGGEVLQPRARAQDYITASRIAGMDCQDPRAPV